MEDDDHLVLPEFIPGNRNFSDFKLAVDALLSKGDQNNGYGVFIRGASNQNSPLATYYRLELYGDGSYAVFKGVVDANGKTNNTTLVDNMQSSVIQPQGGQNHIEITAKGPSITLSLNGQMLKTFSDNSYTGGSIALFVSNLPDAQPGAQAKFSNLAIYPPQA